MKLYHNMTRFQFRRLFPKGSSSERKLLWAVSLKPGDVISACSGFNVRIATIEPVHMSMSQWHGEGYRGRPTGWFIYDHEVTDTAGLFHMTDSCCSKRETVAQIESFWMAPTEEYFAQQEALGWNTETARKLQRILREGGRICDDDGIRLEEPHVTG